MARERDHTETEPAGRTLGEIDHTNPYTNRVFGDTLAYGRGRAVAADGGVDPEDASEEETLSDVSHASPDGTDGPQRSFDRGVNDE